MREPLRLRKKIQPLPWWYFGFAVPITLAPLMGTNGTIWVSAFEQSQALNTLGYTSYYTAVALTVLVIHRLRNRIKLLPNRVALVVLGLCATLGIVLFGLSGMEIIGDIWFLIGLALVGATQAVLMLSWGEVFKVMSAGQMRISHSGSFVVAVGLFSLLNVVGQVAPVMAVAIMLCLPWLSFAALVTGRKAVSRTVPEVPKPQHEAFHMPFKVIAGIAIYGVVFGFMVRMAVSDIVVTPGTAALSYALFFGIALSVFAVALFSDTVGRPGLMYRPVLPLAVIGFLLLPILGREFLPFAGTVAAAGMAYFRIFWLAIAIDIARGVPAPILRTHAWALIADYGGVALGSSIQDALAFSPLFSASQLTVISSAVVVLLILVSMFLFNERGFDDLWGALPLAAPESRESFLEKNCAEVGAAHGLTPREEEILIFLARGRNREYIQNTLALSRHTVTTHIKRIYEKLGVHSHQDLIDLVEGCDALKVDSAAAKHRE
ncbi:MAG: LuxR C-terminal-related transcriptional regulator [Coriobacteriia bacterium]